MVSTLGILVIALLWLSGAVAASSDEGEPTRAIHQSRPAALTRQYLEVPVAGAVGFPNGTVTAAGLADALGYAADKPWISHVVFTIDSAGGDEGEGARLGAVLDEYEDRFVYVALVRRSIGPSLVVTLQCERIFVSEPDDPRVALAAVVDESLRQSEARGGDAPGRAWRAQILRRGRRGGHDARVVEAFVERGSALYAMIDGDGLAHTAGDRPSGRGSRSWRLVDSTKTLLALTARQAIGCGLAEAGGPGAGALGAALGLRWESAGRYGAARMRRAVEVLGRAEERRTRILRSAQRHLQRVESLIEEIDAAVAAAERADPNTSRYRARDGGGVAMLTPRSQARWRRRTDEAIEAWEVVLQIVAAAGRQYERARQCRAWLRRCEPYATVIESHEQALRGLDMVFHRLAGRDVQLLRCADEARRRIRRLVANRNRIRA